MTRSAVILDVDGTLVDSNDAHARAWVDAFAEAGLEVSAERVRRAIGMGGDKLMPHVSGLSEDSVEGRRISERRGEIFTSRYLPHVQPFPRVRELVQRLADDGFTIVVASSAKKDELAKLLEIAGVHDIITSSTSSDDAEQSKPDPDIVHAALSRSGAKQDAAVMLGDTPYDIAAARQVGIPIVAVECGGWQRRDLQGAAEIYGGPADVFDQYAASIFARLAAAAARSNERTRIAGLDARWIAGGLLLLGATLAIAATLRLRRDRRLRGGSIAGHGQTVDCEEAPDAEWDGAPRRRAGLGPRDRAALRRIIARTS